MSGETILIVEDDPTLLRALKDNFDFKGYHVITAADGEAGLNNALDCRPELIVLDIMLPKVNGYEVCRLLRQEGLDVPIIMLTAKDAESDVVLGLEIGADDYVTKPFSIRELLARAHAFLRRRSEEADHTYRFGPYELRTDAHLLTRDGEEVPLTPKEYGLLELLVRRAGKALSREEILDEVWGRTVFVSPRSVDRCVTTLRDKIEPIPAEPTYIHTIRGVGYRFQMPPQTGPAAPAGEALPVVP